MAFRVAALLCASAVAHPGGLECGDERFAVGSTTKCMTLEIKDNQRPHGIRFGTHQKFYHPGSKVDMELKVASPGPYDNSTGQDPYGIFFAIYANAPSSSDPGAFTEVPETVSPKDADRCPHQIYLNNNATLQGGAHFQWTAGAETCGDVNFAMLWGNGPGDAPLAPETPFLYRTVVKISGKPCKQPMTTTTTTPAADKWVCSVCAHVYDAEKDGAGAAFEDLADDWVCPVCGQPKSAYEKQESIVV